MIFVDTSVWYAAYVEEEPDYGACAPLIDTPGDRLVTTDYVIDELLTLLIARGQKRVAKVLGRLLLYGSSCEIIWVDRVIADEAWSVFESFDDKTWSFTDCVSFAVMKRLGIKEAFALDEHFRQFGFAAVRP